MNKETESTAKDATSLLPLWGAVIAAVGSAVVMVVGVMYENFFTAPVLSIERVGESLLYLVVGGGLVVAIFFAGTYGILTALLWLVRGISDVTGRTAYSATWWPKLKKYYGSLIGSCIGLLMGIVLYTEIFQTSASAIHSNISGLSVLSKYLAVLLVAPVLLTAELVSSADIDLFLQTKLFAVIHTIVNGIFLAFIGYGIHYLALRLVEKKK